jgi:hypothetical protein
MRKYYNYNNETLGRQALPTTDVLTFAVTTLTTGSAIVINGPTGATPGILDSLFKVTSDIGNCGATTATYGLLSSTATIDTATAITDTGVNLFLSTVNSNASFANTAYGIRNVVTDAVALGNTDIGTYTSVTNTGATAGGVTKTVIGHDIVASGTLATAGTTNVYGLRVTTTATHAADAGTVNQYGIYVANGTSGTNGTATKSGIYIESPTGADTNYAIYVAGGYIKSVASIQAVSFQATGYFGVQATGISACLRGCLEDVGGSVATKFQNEIALTNDTAYISAWYSDASPYNVQVSRMGCKGNLDLGVNGAATTQDLLTINGAALTTGSAIVATGPTGATAGVTDAFVKLTSDIGNCGATTPTFGLISSTATIDTSTATTDTGVNLFLSTTNSNATNANTVYGVRNIITDAVALGNTDIGTYTSVTNTGAIGAGVIKTVIGHDIVASGTLATDGTTNVYGLRVTTTATHAANAGTVNNWAIKIPAPTSSVNGTSIFYGIELDGAGSADTTYGIKLTGAWSWGVYINTYTNYLYHVFTDGLHIGDTTSSANRYLDIGYCADDGAHFCPGNVDNVCNRNLIVTDAANRGKDHDHDTLSTNPTVFIHSATDPDTDNTEFATLRWNQATIGGDNGSYMTLGQSVTELLTIAAGEGAAGKVTVGNLAPVGSQIMGCAVYVTQAPGGGATNFDIGITGSGNLDQLIDGCLVALGSTKVSFGGNDGTQLPIVNSAATTLTLTTDGDVTGASMIVRIVVYYNQLTAPTA